METSEDPTPIDLSIRLLFDGADFFEGLGEHNLPLRAQMEENAIVFRQMAELMRKDPFSKLNDNTNYILASKLLEDASKFFISLANQNENLAEQMNENAFVYSQISVQLKEDPLKPIDSTVEDEKDQHELTTDAYEELHLVDFFNIADATHLTEWSLSYPVLPGSIYWKDALSYDRKISQFNGSSSELANKVCEFCGFVSRRYQVKLNRTQGDVITKTSVSCVFCAKSMQLDVAEAEESADLIWFPELTQAAVNRLVRDYYVVRIRSDGRIAREAKVYFENRIEMAKRSVNLRSFSEFVSIFSERCKSIGLEEMQNTLKDIRLFPLDRQVVREESLKFNQFPQILAYWRSMEGPYSSRSYDILRSKNRLYSFVRYEEERLYSTTSDEVIKSLKRPKETKQHDGKKWRIGRSQSLLDETLKKAILLSSQNSHASAERLFKKCITIARKVSEGNELNSANTILSLGQEISNKGYTAEAEVFFREYAKIASSMHGPDSMDTAMSYLWLAYNLSSQRKNKAAERIFIKCIWILEGSQRCSSLTLCQTYIGLASSLEAQYRYGEAQKYRLLALNSSKDPTDNASDFLRNSVNLSSNLMWQDKHVEAQVYIHRCRENILEYSNYDVGEVELSVLDMHMAPCLDVRGEYEKSEVIYDRLRNMISELGVDDDNRFVRFYLDYGNHLFLREKYSSARREFESLLQNFDDYFRSSEVSRTFVNINYARVLDKIGGCLIAENLYRNCLRFLRASLIPDYPSLARCLMYFAQNRMSCSDLDEAHSLAVESMEIVRDTFGSCHSLFGRSLIVLSEVESKIGMRMEAAKRAEIACELLTSRLGSQSYWTIEAMTKLSNIKNRA